MADVGVQCSGEQSTVTSLEEYASTVAEVMEKNRQGIEMIEILRGIVSYARILYYNARIVCHSMDL